MQLLKEIYNPLSDTHLVMYRDERKGYCVARRVRSLESSRLGLQWYGSEEIAEKAFRVRLTAEANMSLLKLQWRASAGRNFSFYSLASDNENEYLKKGEYDAQQFRLYNAERDLFKRRVTDLLTPAQAKDLSGTIAADYNIKPPSLAFKARQGWFDRFSTGLDAAASYSRFFHRVSFYGAANVTAPFTCHEMGHAIVGEYFPQATSHGPIFAMIATQLYVRYLGMDADRIVKRFNLDDLYGPGDVEKGAVLAPLQELPKAYESFRPALR